MSLIDDLAAHRARSVAELDALIARVAAVTAATVAKIRDGDRQLGVDEERIERAVAAFLRKSAPDRDWFVIRRNAAAVGITAVMAVEPPQM